jgi:hypothetical protein
MQRFVILMQAVATITVLSRVNGLQVSSIVKLCTINFRFLLLGAHVPTQHSLLFHLFILCRSGFLYVVELPSCYATRQDILVELAAFTDRRSWVNYGDCGVVDNVVSIVARLQAKRSGIRLWAGEKAISAIQTSRPAVWLRSLVFKGYSSTFPREQRGRSVNFTTHLHVVLRLRRRVTITLLPRKFAKYLSKL